MRMEWFKPLLDKLYDSYSARIIIIDKGSYSLYPEVAKALEKDFSVHFYKSELELRSFLNNYSDSRILIIKLPEVRYLPYDIEQSSEIVHWREADLFTTPFQPGEQKGKEHSKESDTFLSEIFNVSTEIDQLLKEDEVAWGKISYLWGRLSFLRDKFFYSAIYSDNASTSEVEKVGENLEQRLKEKFTYFILNHYKNLFFKSVYHEPVTVDKVLPFLAPWTNNKLVLICMDGMGFQEWFCLREHLHNRGISSFKEMHIFSLLPTVTEISRRALFSGKKLLTELPAEKKGFLEYMRQNADTGKDEAEFFLDKHPQLKQEYLAYDYLGIVFWLIDDLAHHTQGVEGDKVLMQQNLEVILHKTELDKIIKRFLEEDYKVIITSDHGSVSSQGIGMKQDKYLMNKRAKRACIFPNKQLAYDFLSNNESLYLYENEELLDNNCAVFAPWRGMFGNEGEKEITHGGIHLEEVVVPFVEVLK